MNINISEKTFLKNIGKKIYMNKSQGRNEHEKI